jgi:hypothetical protein
MGDDPGSRPLEHDGAEVVVGMVMGQHQPPYRLVGRAPDGAEEPRAVSGLASASTTTTPAEVTMKPALGRPFDAPAGVSDHREHSAGELASEVGAGVGLERGSAARAGGEQERMDQAAVKAMGTD